MVWKCFCRYRYHCNFSWMTRNRTVWIFHWACMQDRTDRRTHLSKCKTNAVLHCQLETSNATTLGVAGDCGCLLRSDYQDRVFLGEGATCSHFLPCSYDNHWSRGCKCFAAWMADNSSRVFDATDVYTNSVQFHVAKNMGAPLSFFLFLSE